MAALTHAESRRLYSWWWSSHISPKNSKWLQENLTGMDAKVKAMIKLIEEDADSFARRAEMYYKKRPELMKMVEEFYRAYRALAERYDHAMGELRQAHRTMADAFSNQMPFVIPGESLSASSDTEPQSPLTPHPIRSLLDFDDLQKDAQRSSPHSHVMRRAGAYSEDGELHTSRKGLKQLNERSVGSETSFLAEEESNSNYKEAVLKEEEVKKLQDELSKLSSENQNLASRILLVTEHSDKVETEVQSLRKSLSTLETEKASAIHQYEQCIKKLSSLEAEISQERTFTGKLSGFEERCHFLETLNQALQLEVDALLHKAELQEKVIVDKQEELKKLDFFIKEEQHSSSQAYEALHSLERLQGQCEEEKRILVLELGVAKENLREVETMKRELEQEVQKIKEDNHSLQEHNLSEDLIIKNLQDEILSLKEAKQGLEEEVRLLMSKESVLQQKLSYLKVDMEDLGIRHQFFIEQIESAGFNLGTFHSSIKKLQDETLKLKSIFIKEKDEKLNLLNKLGEMEKVSDKCSLLESSLSDANNELEVLRQNLKGQAESYLSLQTEKADLQMEKNLLISRVELISRVDHIAENLNQISVKNALLENSLCDLTVKLDGFRVKFKELEESSLSLQSENSMLLSERDDLVTQVESIQESLEDLERKFSELEDRNSCLNEERGLALKKISELELLLAEKNEELSLFAESSNSQVVNLEHQIGVLQAEVALRNKEFEEEQEVLFSTHTKVSVLQNCIINMKQQNDDLFGEIQMHNEALLIAKNHVLELQTEVLELKEKVKLMVEKKLKQRVVMNQVSRSLGMETVDIYDDDIENHKVLHQLSGKVENLQWSLLHAEDEIEQLVFERSINNLVLEEMRHEGLNLKSEKERMEHNLMIKMEELSFLRNETSKLLEMENLLQKEVKASMHREVILKTERDTLSSQLSEVRKVHLTLANENYELLEENQSWKKEFCFLRDEKYILEEEYTALLKEALSLRFLSLIFEKFSSEKATELRELCSEVENLHEVNCDLKVVSVMTGQRVRDVELENVLLMETVVKLEDYRSKSVGLESELLRIKGHTEELNSKIEMLKQLLNQQEIDLSYAAMKIEAKNVENIKLQDDVITLKEECFEAKILIESLQQSLTLAENKARYDEKQYMELLGQEEWLMSELKRNINEVEIWETEAVELYKGLQVAGVITSVFKQKAYELGGKCESLQEHFMCCYELNKALRDAENEKMKTKLFALELENEELKHEVTVVLPLIISLKETIFRLEEQALSFTKLHDKEMQIPNSSYDRQPESVCQNDRTIKPSELLGNLQEKVHAAAIAVFESKAYFMEENAKTNEQLETAKMEIEELKGRIKMMPGDVGSTRNARLLKDEGDVSHTGMKDIQLDHVSNRSSPRLTSNVYAGSIHLSGGIESFNFEKDLVVDKIELRRLSGGTQEGSRKIVEKLVSDAERLTNIQANVLDMENRIERVDKAKLTSFEYNSLMTHLREIEGAISQLLEMRGKLIKAAEEESLGSGRRIRQVDERGFSRGRQVSERARRWSEKIARMELEVQQIRFLLFKLEEEYDRKGKKTFERRVQLRDYLSGGTYDTYRKKKRYLCACMEPSTKED